MTIRFEHRYSKDDETMFTLNGEPWYVVRRGEEPAYFLGPSRNEWYEWLTCRDAGMLDCWEERWRGHRRSP